MIITRQQIQNIISEVISPNQLHRCMDGSMCPADSRDCHDDIINRIEDAEYNRNNHNCGTENRIYYNGLLKGLRLKRNKLRKSLPINK